MTPRRSPLPCRPLLVSSRGWCRRWRLGVEVTKGESRDVGSEGRRRSLRGHRREYRRRSNRKTVSPLALTPRTTRVTSDSLFLKIPETPILFPHTPRWYVARGPGLRNTPNVTTQGRKERREGGLGLSWGLDGGGGHQRLSTMTGYARPP